MNKEIKKKWIAALRSGKYKKTTGTLRTRDNRFCALGVLCDVIGPSKWHSQGPFYKWGTQMSTLSTEGMKLAGVDHPMVRLGSESGENILALNDSKGLSFLEIADIIEKNL